MTDETPLTTTPASAAVREAFEAHYADLVEEITPVAGNEGIATQAVDEAFRRAAALPDFAEYGRPREWLAVMARNHVVRKPFRREDLEDTSWERSFGGFERPTLAASLERARAARRKEIARATGLGAAVAAVGVALGVAVPQLVPWASPTSAPAAAPSSPRTSSPPLIPTSTTPSRSVEVWPPTVEDVVGHPSSTIAYTVISTDTPGHKATVWQRCRYRHAGDSQPCEWGENSVLAVEVVDNAGHRMTQSLAPERMIRPAAKGAFAIVPMWGGSSFELISPTIAAKPFTTAEPATPEPGQVFRECDAGPCIVDLRGTVTPLDLPVDTPGRAQWYPDTSDGWLGWTEGDGTSSTVYLQQQDGSFGSVEMTVRSSSFSSPVFFSARLALGGAVIINVGNDAGFGQVAVSTDRGRTWQVRWAGTAVYESGSIDWRTLPIARNPAISIGRLEPIR